MFASGAFCDAAHTHGFVQCTESKGTVLNMPQIECWHWILFSCNYACCVGHFMSERCTVGDD